MLHQRTLFVIDALNGSDISETVNSLSESHMSTGVNLKATLSAVNSKTRCETTSGLDEEQACLSLDIYFELD